MAAKQHLEGKFGLGPHMQNGALMHALAMEPSARLDSKAKAEAWLDSVAASYAAANGVTLGSGGGGAGAWWCFGHS